MQQRRLGDSDLRITPIGLGTWALGGGGWYGGWGPQDDNQSIATIQRALDLGINWIDTAPYYGRGHSEEIVGRAISGQRAQVILATKCGMVWDAVSSKFEKRLTAASVRRELEKSLRRLNTDFVDLYQIHTPAETDAETEEGWGIIGDLICEGKVRAGGISNFSLAQHKRMQARRSITSSQPSYNMVLRTDEAELLPYCAAQKIGAVVARPLLGGLLSGKFSVARAAQLPDDDWRKRRGWFQDPELSATLALVEGLRRVATRLNGTVAQVAIAWVLRCPEVTAAIVGARHPLQIEEDVAAGDMKLSPQDLAEIEQRLQEREHSLK